MIVKEKIGNITNFQIGEKDIDYLYLDWFETGKRILHKKTTSGQEVVMKFLRENQQLGQGDILYADEKLLIVVAIHPCECLIKV
jgi:urease accessory protein